MKMLAYRKYLIIISLVVVSIHIQAQNGWTKKADIIHRGGGVACVYENKIYAIGGSGDGPNYVPLQYNQVYNPATNTWEDTTESPTAHNFHVVARVNDTIYVLGGGYPTFNYKIEAYHPPSDQWKTKQDIPRGWLSGNGVVVDGKIYLIAGNYNEHECWAYDPITEEWSPKSPVPSEGGGSLSAVVYNGLIYTFGGSNYSPWSPKNTVYEYNPQTDQWTRKTDMPTARFALKACVVNGLIFVIGGCQSSNTSLATVEFYDPLNDTWGTATDMPINLGFHSGEVFNNKIYIMGGTSDWSYVRSDVWEYDPSQDPNVPVEFTSFTASANGEEVILNWSTATELNNFEFEVQRSFEGSEFVTIGVVYGKGTTTERQDYTYSDKNLSDGNYFYRLKQVDYDGSYEYSEAVEVDFRAFKSYLLEQNYPNPFNPATTIGFGLQEKVNVKITILNSIGEEVAVLLNEEKESGYHTVEFSVANLPSGVYFYQLRVGSYVETKKMLLLK